MKSYVSPLLKNNFKKGDKIVCINNIGMTDSLVLGKTYTVRRTYKEVGRFHVEV